MNSLLDLIAILTLCNECYLAGTEIGHHGIHLLANHFLIDGHLFPDILRFSYIHWLFLYDFSCFHIGNFYRFLSPCTRPELFRIATKLKLIPVIQCTGLYTEHMRHTTDIYWMGFYSIF